MRRLSILQVCGSAAAGKWFTLQVGELVRRGHHVEVVLPEEGDLAERLRASGVRVHVIPFRGYRPAELLRVASGLVRLRSLVRRGRYDVVHAHLIKAIIMTRLALRGTRPVLVSQVPGVVHLDIPWIRRIDIATMRFDDVTVASCEEFGRVYRDLGAKRVRVCHYGLDSEDFLASQTPKDEVRHSLGLRDADVAFGIVAHMYPTTIAEYREIGVKGHEVFLDAARRVLDVAETAKFYVIGDEFAGDGSYRAALEARVADLPPGSVRFLGHREDIPNLVAAMDVLVNPSMSESACYAIMEGSLSGKPVIGTRVGGLPDSIVDGVTGFLVPRGDPDSLADAMLRLLQDPELRSRFGAAGRVFVREKMDISATTVELEAIYGEALQEERATR